MLAEYPSDTHLSQSSTARGKSPLARSDDDNGLETHAVLLDGTTVALALVSAGVALGAVAVKAAPRVKSEFISLKSKLSRPAKQTADTDAPAPLTVVAEIEPEQPDAPRLRAV